MAVKVNFKQITNTEIKEISLFFRSNLVLQSVILTASTTLRTRRIKTQTMHAKKINMLVLSLQFRCPFRQFFLFELPEFSAKQKSDSTDKYYVR